MSSLDPASLIRHVRELPPLPSVVQDLIASFERDDVDIGTLADKISADQALAAKILRLANSSFYGLPAKVKTVQQAIVVLGCDSARALAVASGIVNRCGQPAGADIDVTRFWRHSIATALCAKALARHCRADADEAFLVGLLHDIGRLVLASACPDEYRRVSQYLREHDASTAQAERQVLGVDHQRVGQMLAELWKFPPAVQRAIAQHHGPAPHQHELLGSVVHVADVIVHLLDVDGDAFSAAPVLLDQMWNELALRDDQVRQVCLETEAQFEEACKLFLSDVRNEAEH